MKNQGKLVCVIQARLGSMRLPNKVLRSVGQFAVIELMLARVQQASRIDQIIVATSVENRDDKLADFVEKLGFTVFRGSEQDVLARFAGAAKQGDADTVMRLTGDCPFVDPRLIDDMVAYFFAHDLDYLNNADPPTFPDGLDVEIMTADCLANAHQTAVSPAHREHVTLSIRESHSVKKDCFLSSEDYSHLRWTVDEKDDLERLNRLFQVVGQDPQFDALQLAREQNEKSEGLLNQRPRDEGMKMSSGQKLWRRAVDVIPGGNMLLSKRSEMFLPEQWPSYYSKAKGAEVWDLDGNKFVDMSIMGVGTNILGYGHAEVDEAAMGAIRASNMSTLNSPGEVFLAEKLIEMHPWAGGVRFARSGGEANAIAVRIARAFCGKEKVAICGYHGWHDWYLSVNLTEKDGLSDHLLEGLSTAGVPKNLRGSVFPFKYNNINAIEQLVRQQDIGVIKMEVARNEQPHQGYLQAVRNLCDENGIVLIFDECSSGFRQSFGGLHKIYGVEPDIAMFGKALGNGFAITAVVGRKEIMDAAQTSFISSTFWTERIGPEAALKCLEVQERERSWEQITQKGEFLRSQWMKLAETEGLKINLFGIPALSGFAFQSNDHQKYKTLITQEMLKRGFLAANTVYLSTAHSDEFLARYLHELQACFKLIAECENGRDVDTLLEGPVSHSGFSRLN